METNKGRREAAVLVLVVFFLGVAFGALGNHLWTGRVSGGQRVMNTKPTRDQVLNDLSQRLELTPDQQKKITVLIDDTRAKWHALDVTIDPEKEQIRQQFRANVRTLLTPEQQLKLDDYLKKLDEQRKKDAVTAGH